VDVNRNQPLFEACSKGHLEVAELLLASGRWLEISNLAISTCHKKGFPGLAKQLIAHRQHQDAASVFSLIIFHCDHFIELKNKQATQT
jgi:ankyrin repeat protein